MVQIPLSISLIVLELKDCLGNIGVMDHIIWQSSLIQGLTKQYVTMYFVAEDWSSHTSDPLCCRVSWSLIWHCTHILFKRPILTSHQALLTYDLSPGMPLSRIYPLHITFEWFILLHSKHILFLSEYFQSVAASTHRVSCFIHYTFRCRWLMLLHTS